MIAKIKRKPILIGILSLIVVALVAVFAIPSLAAGAPPNGPRAGANQNMTIVKGSIAVLTNTSITINETGTTPASVTLALNSSTNFNIHGNGWFNSASLIGNSVTAAYANNQTVTLPVASQVSINTTTTTPGIANPQAQTPNGANPPANRTMARAQGTLTVSNGTITITPTTGSPVGPLTLDANIGVNLRGASLALDGNVVTATATLNGAASVSYNSQTKVVNQITINMPTTPPAKGTPPANNSFARVQGTLTVSGGTISIAPATGSTVGPLALDANTSVNLRGASVTLTGSTLTATATLNGAASASYSQTATPPVVSQITINLPTGTPGPGNPRGNFGSGFGGFFNRPAGR